MLAENWTSFVVCSTKQEVIVLPYDNTTAVYCGQHLRDKYGCVQCLPMSMKAWTVSKTAWYTSGAES